MNSNNMNNFMKKAQAQTGIDINKMKEAGEKGQLDDFVNKNLSPEASEKLKSVLSDKAACEKLLSTPQAKELLKKFTEGK